MRSKVIGEAKPEICLFGATGTGRDLAGAIATHLPTGLTADTTELDVEPPPSRLLLASRPAFSEKMMATILCKQYRPQMATARAGVFQALPRDTTREGEIVRIANAMTEEQNCDAGAGFHPGTRQNEFGGSGSHRRRRPGASGTGAFCHAEGAGRRSRGNRWRFQGSRRCGLDQA